MKRYSMILLFVSIITTTAVCGHAIPDTIFITGSMIDSVTNEPLIGASVVITKKNSKPTKTGAATDMNGDYRLAVSKEDYKKLKTGSLRYSYVGYETKNIDNIQFQSQEISVKLITRPGDLIWGGPYKVLTRRERQKKIKQAKKNLAH